jgi:phosphate transport system substrate-binding protein
VGFLRHIIPGLLIVCLHISQAKADELICAGGETMAGLTKAWAGLALTERLDDQIQVQAETKLAADGFQLLLDRKIGCVTFVREPFDREYAAYQKSLGHPPLLIPVAGGSFDTKGGTHALAVYVHRDNPLRKLTLQQLDSVLSKSLLRGARQTAMTWGDLGVTGPFADHPIHVYGMIKKRETGDPPGIMNFLTRRVMLGGEFRGDWIDVPDRPGRAALDGITDQIEEDRDAIGISGLANVRPNLIALQLSETGDNYVPASRDSVQDHSYPLARRIYLMVDVDDHLRPASLALALIHAALSDRGQAMIAEGNTGFLPLPKSELNLARRSLACPAPMPFYLPPALAFPRGASYMTPKGAIRIVGYNDMAPMIARWITMFQLFHPGFTFDAQLPATRAAPAALAAGTSLLAPMGAPYDPDSIPGAPHAIGFDVAHASLNPHALSGPLGIYVPVSSPLRSISLSELADIFTGRGGHADQFHAIGLANTTALGQFMNARVMSGQPFRPDFTGLGQSRDVIKAVAHDPAAIGFAAAQTATADVRPLALSRTPNDRAIALSEDTIRSSDYPLDRRLLIYANGPSAGEMDKLGHAFLDMVLSCAGQNLIEDDALGYLPLMPADVLKERQKLTIQP